MLTEVMPAAPAALRYYLDEVFHQDDAAMMSIWLRKQLREIGRDDLNKCVVIDADPEILNGWMFRMVHNPSEVDFQLIKGILVGLLAMR